MMNIQSLTLMVMVVMVFDFTLSQNDRDVQLKDIKKEAEILETKNLTCHVYDQKHNGGTACMTGFFCLAEKVLEHFPHNKHKKLHPRSLDRPCDKNSTHEDVKDLLRVLHAYNKDRNLNCHLKTNEKYPLNIFAGEVKGCAIRCLNDPDNCKDL